MVMDGHAVEVPVPEPCAICGWTGPRTQYLGDVEDLVAVAHPDGDHLPDWLPRLRAAAPVVPVQTPPEDERVTPRWVTTERAVAWEREVQAERARQIAKGYDEAHDDQHGVDHLLGWAEVYELRGEHVKAWALVRAAREYIGRHPAASQTPPEVSGTDAEPADPIHEKGCIDWCNHCAICGAGCLYGARCHAHEGVYPTSQTPPEPECPGSMLCTGCPSHRAISDPVRERWTEEAAHQTPSREAIARIVNPSDDVWGEWGKDTLMDPIGQADARNESLAKADAVLALLASTGEPEKGGE